MLLKLLLLKLLLPKLLLKVTKRKNRRDTIQLIVGALT